MTPTEKIKKLRELLIESEAISLQQFRQIHENGKEWGDLSAEEQEAGLWYAEYLLDKQHPELAP